MSPGDVMRGFEQCVIPDTNLEGCVRLSGRIVRVTVESGAIMRRSTRAQRALSFMYH